MATENRICLECSEELKGRADQKFCSDHCRNAYNNRHNSDQNNLMRNINNVLRRNRRILMELCPCSEVKVNRDVLLYKGFNFNHITHVHEEEVDRVYYYCYELAYMPLSRGEVLIVRSEEP